MPPIIRQAEKADYTGLYSFTNALNYLHRHLDWRDTLEWLGRQPFLLMEERNQILATLACPPEPKEVAWVRLFGASMRTSPDRAWKLLFERALENLRALTPSPLIVSISLRDWYADLLQRNGFTVHQDIVVFLYDQRPPVEPTLQDGIRIRELQPDDLPAVAKIDALAFEPIWRLSLEDLRFARNRSSYCTVAERDGEILGYTMSSNNNMYAHLARLAIHPSLQRQHLGYALVQDLLSYFINRMDYAGVTLNTQHDNSASLALYHKIGFRETGERFPVYIYSY